MALPEQNRVLNLWVVDETGDIARDPVAWTAGFIEDLEPVDVAGYSVDELVDAREAEGSLG